GAGQRLLQHGTRAVPRRHEHRPGREERRVGERVPFLLGERRLVGHRDPRYFPSSISMASTTAGSSGVTDGANRATISPSREMRNFSKFQSTSGSGFGSRPCSRRRSRIASLPGATGNPSVSAPYSGCWSSPTTLIFDITGNVTEYCEVQNSAISASLPGS